MCWSATCRGLKMLPTILLDIFVTACEHVWANVNELDKRKLLQLAKKQVKLRRLIDQEVVFYIDGPRWATRGCVCHEALRSYYAAN